MSGINAPSIVTYSYKVSNTFDTYINVSFPFRVKLREIWFTGDRKLLTGTDGSSATFENSFRVLKLCALKAKSPKVVLSDYDPPSDWNWFFGIEDSSEQMLLENPDYSLKPTMWLGIPDDSTAEVLKDSTTQFLGMPWYDAGFRSSSSTAPEMNSIQNGYWSNNGWSEEQFTANKYKTDLAVMNPDEILSMFLFNDAGDWTDYDGEGIATIHIAYEGIGSGVSPEATKTPWNDWWYD